jgi:hypothetical protein
MATLTDNRQSVDVSTNKTLAITDVGIVQNVIADGVVITLPATVVGYSFTVRNGGVKATGGAYGTGSDASAGINVSPNAVDKIAGNGFTATDDKDAINTKATAKVGDEIRLIGDGANGWFLETVKGTWAREA